MPDHESTAALSPARQIAAGVVLCADQEGQSAAWIMWQWCRRDYESLHVQLRKHADSDVQALLDAVGRRPADTEAHDRLVTALAEALAKDDVLAGELEPIRRHLTQTARLRMHIGPAVSARPDVEPLSVQAIAASIGTSHRRPSAAPARAVIVIPFRAREGDGRMRNLVACLAALNDQSLSRDEYRIVVVESDDAPRWPSAYRQWTDTCVFAYNPGRFNKAWAVNCGVVHADGRDELICVLDGDMLPDADFLARSVARFDDDTLQGHWPHRTIMFADAPSSEFAVHTRLVDAEPDVNGESLRGTVLYRSPGCCIWVRRSLFDRIAGMDERFEGWGGEDNDFAWRAELYGGLERYDDHMIHLHHARTVPPTTGEAMSMDSYRWCTWPTDSAIGGLDKYRGL